MTSFPKVIKFSDRVYNLWNIQSKFQTLYKIYKHSKNFIKISHILIRELKTKNLLVHSPLNIGAVKGMPERLKICIDF